MRKCNFKKMENLPFKNFLENWPNSGNVIIDANKRLSVLEQNQNSNFETLKTTIMGNKVLYELRKKWMVVFKTFNDE